MKKSFVILFKNQNNRNKFKDDKIIIKDNESSLRIGFKKCII